LRNWARLFSYRDLLRNLVARDLKVRYKNSALGIIWSLLNPLGMMIVFTVVFTILIPNNSIDRFPIFVMCGLLPWNWFSGSVVGSIYSVVGSSALVKKVYFPREILPISTVLSNLVHFLIALIVLFAMMLVTGTPLTVWALILPLVIAIQLIFSLGLAFFLSSINVYYRDTAQIMEVLMLAWFFLTPVFYTFDQLPRIQEHAHLAAVLHYLNFVTPPLLAIRDPLFFGRLPSGGDTAYAIGAAAVALALGAFVFQRVDDQLAAAL